jgi:hypothetical protein
MRPIARKRRSIVALVVVLFAGFAGQAAAVPSDGENSCKITYGGRITTAAGDMGTFGGVVHPGSGQLEYQDHGPATDINVHSIEVQSVFCVSDASVNGEGSYEFQLDLVDAGEPGTSDIYRIQLSNGYDSGEQVLFGGNVQIH